MNQTTLSVVIPYYNEAGFLPQTLRSLLAQTRVPDQLILVDNGSTDGTEELCRAIRHLEARSVEFASQTQERRA